MGNRKTIGIIILVVGIIVLLLSLLADPLGIGRSTNPTFGTNQIAGTIAGVIVTVVGLVLAFRK